MEQPEDESQQKKPRLTVYQGIVRVCEQLEVMLEDMISEIVAQRFLPLNEVRSWKWSRLLRTHRQVRRARWEQFRSGVQEVQYGVQIGLAPLFSKTKPKGIPSYEELDHDDAFDAPKKRLIDDPWAKYKEANKLDR